MTDLEISYCNFKYKPVQRQPDTMTCHTL